MDDNKQKNFIQQSLNNIINALGVTTARSSRDLAVLKGVVPPIEKVGDVDGLENKFAQMFTGYMDLQYDRQSMYRDFDNMDRNSTWCQTGLDIYAEEAAQRDAKTGLKVWITSKDDKVASELNGMLQRIKMEQKAYGIYRSIAKYGDCFLYLVLGAYGVHDTQWVHPIRVERLQSNGLMGFKSVEISKFVPTDNKNNLFKPWDFVHARNLAYDRETIYGTSIMNSLRKVYKQLSMMETLLCIFRLTKSLQRNIFFVDVGYSAPQEAETLLKQYQKFISNKSTFIDQRTNEFRLDFNPATLLQDIVWPVRPNSKSDVKQLQNTSAPGPIEDLEYLRTQIRTGFNIPKAYFDGEFDGGWNSKEALMLQDTRFSRKIQKLQDCMRETIIKICQIHWAITHQEYLPPEAFKVELGTVSDQADRMREDILLRKAQIMEILVNMAVTAGLNRWVWADYLFDEIFPLPAQLRAKLYTPDPVQNMAFNNEVELIKLTQGAEGGGSSSSKDGKGKSGKSGDQVKGKFAAGGRGLAAAMKKILPAKPQKKVTADNLRTGLRGFGKKREDIELPAEVTSLIEELQDLEKFNEQLTESYKDFGSVIQCRNFGFTRNEIEELTKDAKVIREGHEANKDKVDWDGLSKMEDFFNKEELHEDFKEE